MEIGFPFLDALFNILIVLAVIPALWVAGRIVLRNSIIDQMAVRLFVWLVLGGFFLIPLVGLVSVLRNLLSVILSGQTASPLDQKFLGLTIPALYAAMDAIIWLIGYGIALFYGPRLMRQYGARVSDALRLTPLEQAFAVLGLAGLFITMLKGFTSYPLPIFAGLMSGDPLSGLLVGAGGLFLLIVAALVMSARLRGV